MWRIWSEREERKSEGAKTWFHITHVGDQVNGGGTLGATRLLAPPVAGHPTKGGERERERRRQNGWLGGFTDSGERERELNWVTWDAPHDSGRWLVATFLLHIYEAVKPLSSQISHPNPTMLKEKTTPFSSLFFILTRQFPIFISPIYT